MEAITLNIVPVLKAARVAFDDKTLDINTCTYAGPCAIGAALTPDERACLDALDGEGSPDITHLLNIGAVITDNPSALIRLQVSADGGNYSNFAWMLEQLEREFIQS